MFLLNLNYLRMKFWFSIFLLSISTLSFSQIDGIILSLQNYQKAELDNGMKVIVVKTDAYGYLSYRFCLDFKPFFEDDISGATEVLTKMMGCELDNKTLIVKEMVSAENAIDSLCDFMSKVLLRPNFHDSINISYKNKRIENIKKYSTNYDSIITNYCRLFNFTENHPYHEYKTEHTINNINSTELKNIHQKIFLSQNAYLVVVGNIDIDTLLPYVERYFADWNTTKTDQSEDFKVPEIDETKITFIEDNSLEKNYVNISYPVEFKINNDDYLASCIFSKIYMKNNYGIIHDYMIKDDILFEKNTTKFSSDPYCSMFSLQTYIKSDDVKDYIEEISELMTDYEILTESPHLQTAKEELITSFENSFIKPYNVAKYAYNLDKYKLSKDFYSNYKYSVNKITPAKIVAVAKKYFKPQNANIIIVGKKEPLFCPFQKLSEFYQIDEFKDNNLTTLYQKGFGAQTIINEYLNASYSKYYFSDLSINFDAVYVISEDSILLQGKILRKNEEFYLYYTEKQEDSLTVLFHQLEIYNGKQWLDSTINYHTVFEKKDIKSRLYKTFLFPEEYFDKINYNAYLLCDKDLYDNNIYKILVKTPDDVEFNEYYDIISKLKIKTEKVFDDDVVETYEYFDYQLLENGVTVPFTIMQTSKYYKIILKITSFDYTTKLKFSDYKIQY